MRYTLPPFERLLGWRPDGSADVHARYRSGTMTLCMRPVVELAGELTEDCPSCPSCAEVALRWYCIDRSAPSGWLRGLRAVVDEGRAAGRVELADRLASRGAPFYG